MDDSASRNEPSLAERLATPVQFLKGVGPQRGVLFERLGMYTARDVLFGFPRDYQDLTQLDSLAALEDGKLVRLRGVVREVELRSAGTGRSLLGVLVQGTGGHMRALWFNQPFMRDRFAVGQEVLLTGKVKLRSMVWQMSHPHVTWLESDADQPLADALVPIYALTEGLAQSHVRRVAREVVETLADQLDEVFPPEYRAAHDLLPLRDALRRIHNPPDRASLDRARRRFIYQELLVMQLALAIKHRRQRDQCRAPALEATAKIDARIRRLFPFEWTPGQEHAIAEVRADLAQPYPMNRLLQGDVGSGKTVVALYAVLVAVAHGYQAALMAPTELLARQHADTLGKVLSASRVRWECLVGGLPTKERQALLADIAAGSVSVVIGTQAVLQSDVQFARLGVVVIDEQHKFGVRQRATLRQAGLDPHYLVMTATPIPRTVAMTLFGDLDVSTLADHPPGRQKVHTYLAGQEQHAPWWDFFARKLGEGRQGYVVAPLVEGDADEALDESPLLAGAESLYESLANGPLEAFRLGLVHGRMSPAEKDAAMEAFRTGRTQVLVSTTVIEVGIDVPNATLLTIEGGERFGLSQLHQLRGRISRGTHPGYCCVFAEAASSTAQARLDAFVRSTDGFELAEIDFALRGPGDVLGTRQHGLPPLVVADLVRDAEVLEETRREARQMIGADAELAAPEWRLLRRMVFARYGQALELGDVG